jgi:hypothetical protein
MAGLKLAAISGSWMASFGNGIIKRRNLLEEKTKNILFMGNHNPGRLRNNFNINVGRQRRITLEKLTKSKKGILG